MNSAARLELFLYDTEKIKVESDDPQSAILFHYPPELTDKQVLTHAGHFAALYLASHAFTAFSASVKPNFSPMTIKLTKGGHCEILPWQEGRKLIIIFQRPLTSKLCLIDENAQNGDFDENEESDGFCSILKNDIEMGLQRISSQITDLDLIIWFGGFCKTFLENPGISHPSLHNVKSAFHQIQRLFQALRPVHQWTIYGSVMQRCHSSSLKDKGQQIFISLAASIFIFFVYSRSSTNYPTWRFATETTLSRRQKNAKIWHDFGQRQRLAVCTKNTLL